MNPLKKFGIELPPLPSTPPAHDPQRSTLLQLAVIIGLAVLMHFQIADKTIAAIAALVFALKVGLVIKGKNAPNRIAMMVLTISSLVLIITFYGGWNGQRAGISFLVLLVTLKFLESRGLRDYFVVCLILYFLAASSFLFNSSILSIVIVIGYTLVITSILFQLSNPQPIALLRVYRSSIALVAKAIPLAILLFFFFPRIQGNFGFLPTLDNADSEFELNNSLVVGDLAAGAFNLSLAFRVKFDGQLPPLNALYWRAKVMTAERNFQWQIIEPKPQDFVNSKEFQNQLSLEDGPVKYEIYHTATKDNFLPYLDYLAGNEKGRALYDYSVFLGRASPSAFKYRGSSNLTPPLSEKDELDLARLLQVQNQPSAKMQALLFSWRNSNESRAELINAVYRYFSENPFSYTLSPEGLEDERPMEDFLFNTRSGYCEHYASAFTTIMRWLDIPARVVVGYQGGRSINNGTFLEVRYSDAHAWSEVWLDGYWQRVDPTSAVSPERIEFGMDALRELYESGVLGGNSSGQALADFLNPTGTARLIRDLRDTWSNATYQWNKWVVDYDFETQKELLSNLGFDGRRTAYTLIIFMFAGVGALLLFYFWQLVPGRIKRTELQSVYLNFANKFKKAALARHVAESPREFARRAIVAAPEHATLIEEITLQYEQLRYGKTDSNAHQEFQQFKQAVKAFKLKGSRNQSKKL